MRGIAGSDKCELSIQTYDRVSYDTIFYRAACRDNPSDKKVVKVLNFKILHPQSYASIGYSRRKQLHAQFVQITTEIMRPTSMIVTDIEPTHCNQMSETTSPDWLRETVVDDGL